MYRDVHSNKWFENERVHGVRNVAGSVARPDCSLSAAVFPLGTEEVDSLSVCLTDDCRI